MAARLAAKLQLKPPLKWAGGKRWLVHYLKPLWQPHEKRRFVEPFCGGLAVVLGLSPRRALLSDVNPHNINFYLWLKRGLDITLDMKNEESSFYHCRKRFNELIARGEEASREAAELFYYLNRTGYNGLCRFNKQGTFNVPFGRYKTINYGRDFSGYSKIFAGWEFTAADFEALDTKPGDFIYADPPYDVEFTNYAKEGFSWEDQVRLAEWLVKRSGPVVVSNQATKRILNLYRKLGFKLRLLDAPRMISCTGDRTKSKEVLACKGV